MAERDRLSMDSERSIRAQLERIPDSDAITVTKARVRAVLAEYDRRGDELAKLRTAVSAVLDILNDWQLAAHESDGTHAEAVAFDAAHELIVHYTEQAGAARTAEGLRVDLADTERTAEGLRADLAERDEAGATP